MSEKVSPTLKVLHEMRRDVAQLRVDLADVRDGLAGTNARIDHLETSVVRELSQVNVTLSDMKELLATRLDDRKVLRDHERRIRALERKAG